jgi:hypothetical protein
MKIAYLYDDIGHVKGTSGKTLFVFIVLLIIGVVKCE